MENTFQPVNDLINQSNGKSIALPSGTKYSFRRDWLYTEAELDGFEASTGIALPADYRDFLTSVGACHLYVDEYELGFKIHRLEEVKPLMGQVFAGMSNPYPNLFLAVTLQGRGDEAGFDLTKKENNFSTFSHEEDPEQWAAGTERWIRFSDWLKKLIDSEAETDLV